MRDNTEIADVIELQLVIFEGELQMVGSERNITDVGAPPSEKS
jgi:hypothetical protein